MESTPWLLSLSQTMYFQADQVESTHWWPSPKWGDDGMAVHCLQSGSRSTHTEKGPSLLSPLSGEAHSAGLGAVTAGALQLS